MKPVFVPTKAESHFPSTVDQIAEWKKHPVL